MYLHKLLQELRDHLLEDGKDGELSFANIKDAADAVMSVHDENEEVVVAADVADVVIDVGGRILFGGVHVGYLNKVSHVSELRSFVEAMGAEFPAYAGDFLTLTEGDGNGR